MKKRLPANLASETQEKHKQDATKELQKTKNLEFRLSQLRNRLLFLEKKVDESQTKDGHEDETRLQTSAKPLVEADDLADHSSTSATHCQPVRVST